MHKFVRNLITEWRKLNLPFENASVLITVSGGADSLALMLALHDLREAKKLSLNFIVAHFNHQLRGADADTDAEFVNELAKKLNLRFVCENWKIKTHGKRENLEQSARKARYEFFLKTAEKENAFAVLTAHTVNDQAETFLLNLLRGSGVDGLGAMRKVRVLCQRDREMERQSSEKQKFSPSLRLSVSPSPLLIRPLIGWSKREDTESFVREKGIEFCRDSMNSDEKFSRVRIRKKLIPFLKEFNPKIVETLAQTAFLLQKDAEQRSIVSGRWSESLPIKELQNLSQSEFYTVLRQWLKMTKGNLKQIGLHNIQAIERLVFSRKSGRKVELPGGDFVIKKDGKIFFEKTKVEKSRSDN